MRNRILSGILGWSLWFSDHDELALVTSYHRDFLITMSSSKSAAGQDKGQKNAIVLARTKAGLRNRRKSTWTKLYAWSSWFTKNGPMKEVAARYGYLWCRWLLWSVGKCTWLTKNFSTWLTKNFTMAKEYVDSPLSDNNFINSMRWSYVLAEIFPTILYEVPCRIEPSLAGYIRTEISLLVVLFDPLPRKGGEGVPVSNSGITSNINSKHLTRLHFKLWFL